jgi:hypothetical protein
MAGRHGRFLLSHQRHGQEHSEHPRDEASFANPLGHLPFFCRPRWTTSKNKPESTQSGNIGKERRICRFFKKQRLQR